MTIEQTVEVPASRRLTITVPPEVPVGPVVLTFTPAAASAAQPLRSLRGIDKGRDTMEAYFARHHAENDRELPELSAAERKAAMEEPLPRVTRAEREEWAKDPVIQFLDTLPVEPDWSWLPEGKTPETATKADFRAFAIKMKYGDRYDI
jgi:hypothetical protein